MHTKELPMLLIIQDLNHLKIKWQVMNNCALDGNNTSKQAKNKKVKKNYMRNVGHSVSKTIIRKT